MTNSINREIIGGKARNLFLLQELDLCVPSFVVIPHSLLIKDNIAEALNKVMLGIEDASTKTYAVRSSADIEDGANHSFAGMFTTQLNVPFSDLEAAILDVYNSTNTIEVTSYMNVNNITEKVHMAVIIQEMIDADVSGVAFSDHVDSRKEGILINSVFGLGEALVSGEVKADSYHVINQKIESDIANQSKALHLQYDGGLAWSNLDSKFQNVSSLSETQVLDVSNVLLKLAETLGYEVDIEFAYKYDVLYMLQVRPITGDNSTVNEKDRIVWDNSNIIESYPGVTTPLTFSFISDMYKVVYTQFSALLGTSHTELEDNKEVFANMLGHLNGRVYYNLKSWYEVLAMVPGYKINAPFMEKMMGVKESFELDQKSVISKRKAWWSSIKSIFKLIKSFIGLKKRSAKFMIFSNDIISEYKSKDYSTMSASEMSKEYKSFEKVLSHRWNAPLINDFFAMIFFGVFSKWTTKLTPEKPHCINDLLIGSQDIVSIEPMRRSIAIAKFIKENKRLSELFTNKSDDVLNALILDKNKEISTLIGEYITDFGDRCPEELKLETRTYTQNPELFIELLQSYLDIDLERFSGQSNVDQRLIAEQLCLDSISRNPIKRILFKWMLKKTRYLISNRENLRFQRTKGYAVVRLIFDQIEARMMNDGFIDESGDIYYLTKEEIFGFINGSASDTNIKRLIVSRKSDFYDYTNQKMKDRITTYGAVNSNDLIDHSSKFDNSELSGVGCCPGIVEAEVSVVIDPKAVKSLNNTILIARFTDPGWVRLFPSAAGIIVEKGSLLSHSAIVARELGIPCIVAVDGLMETMNTGDKIIMDGGTGQISML